MSLVYTAPASSAGGSRNSVYIGGRAEAKSLEKLERWGVSRILNVTPAKETSIQAGVPNFFEKSGKFVYKRIPVYDAATSATTLEGRAQEIVSFISNGLFHGSVLVHCHHGVSRSTTCVVLYLMRKVEMSLADAMTTIHRRRPQAQPIPAFMQLLERYEKDCGQSNTATTIDDSTSRPKKKRKTIERMTKGPSIGPARGPPTAPQPPKDPKRIVTLVGPSARGPSMIGPSRGPPTTSTLASTGKNNSTSTTGSTEKTLTTRPT